MKNIFYFIFILLILNSCMDNKIEEVVVIGGGLMGSSTAWQLSKAGQQVLLLEQQDSIYDSGSSYGEARITRSLGAEGDIFSYLQQLSTSETGELIDFLKTSASAKNHSLEDIYTVSPVTYLFYNLPKDSAMAMIQGQDLRTDYLPDALTAKEEFNLTIPDSMSVIREHHRFSGTMNPKALIGKLHEGIQKKGSRIAYNEQVISIERKDAVYELEIRNRKSGSSRKISSRKVVSAAGPYTGSLLKDLAPYMDHLITTKRLFLAFLKFKPEYYEGLSLAQQQKLKSFFPVAEMSPELYYSMIEKIDEDGIPIIKVGGHMLRYPIEDLNKVWQVQLSDEEIKWSVINTVRYLNMLNIPAKAEDLEFYNGYSCVYSLTDSEIPYLTTLFHSDGSVDPNFVVVSGMSGIGAKASLAYGLIATDILLSRSNDDPMYQKTIDALGAKQNSGHVMQIPMDYKDGGDPNNLAIRD